MPDATKSMRIVNKSTRRIIIGPPPRRELATNKIQHERQKLIRFDTPADDSVDKAKRHGRSHVIDGDRAKFLKTPVMKQLMERLELQVTGG